jgi:HlyD family secretion protein
VLEARANVYVLPLSAIARDGKQAYCWVVQDGLAKRRPITTGLQVGNDVEVTAGLNDDETIVQSQIATLQEGQPVEVAKYLFLMQ